MRIKDLGNTATDFASDDYIALDGSTNGSRKMENDKMLTIAAQKAIAGNVSPAFDPSKPNDEGGYAYYSGENVSYNGKNYVFIVNHSSGQWNSSEVEQKPLSESVNLQGVGQAVNEWLNSHPEATTTVLDHSLTNKKLVIGTLNFVTPDMFGAACDGVTDDSEPISQAVATGLPVDLGGKTCLISQTIHFEKLIIRNGKIKIPASESRFEVFVCLSVDGANTLIDVQDIVFETTRENFAFVIDTDHPLSSAGKYNNIMLFHYSSNKRAKVLLRNSSFINIDFVIKGDSVETDQDFVAENCNINNVVNFLQVFSPSVLVDGCVFTQYEYANQYYRFVYHKGNENVSFCSTIVRNCIIDAVMYPIGAGPGGSDIHPSFRVKVLGCSITTKGTFSKVSENSDMEIVGCSIICGAGVYGEGVTSKLQVSSTTIKLNELGSVQAPFIVYGCNCVFSNCFFEDITQYFYNQNAEYAGLLDYVFLHCSFIRNISGRLIRFVGLQKSIKFLDCIFIGRDDDQMFDINSQKNIVFVKCYFKGETLWQRADTHLTLDYAVVFADCVCDLANERFYDSRVTVKDSFKTLGYAGVNSTGIYEPKLVNGSVEWQAVT